MMYKLILVDDEEEVRQGIIQKIEWEKYGFEIIGEVENGREALELILYNTLDSIVWMNENRKYDGVTTMVAALAKLFRISISRGNELISIQDELQKPLPYSSLIGGKFYEKSIENGLSGVFHCCTNSM